MKSQRRKWLLAVCLLAAAGIGGTCLYLKHTKAPMSSLEELNAPVNSIYYTSPEEEHIALDTETGVEYIDNELLVISLKTEEELNEALESRKGKAVGYIEDISLYQVKFEETYSRKELEALGEQLTEAGIITSFMENLVTCLSTDFLPSDQRWEKEWNSGSLSETWPLEAIHMEQAWDFMDRMNDPVSVGIFDTGFFDTHEDLSFAATPLANQLEESSGKLDPHGTAVAGVIGAGLDNETGISGIIPDKVQELYGVSAWGLTITENKIDLMAVQTGLAYLISVRQCRVINVSLSLWDAGQEEDPENSELFREYTDALTCLFSGLLDSGNDFIICKSAGNDPSLSAAADPVSAISDETVRKRILVVEAVGPGMDGSMELASYSSSGSRTDLSAPGGNDRAAICTTWVEEDALGIRSSQYQYVQGTSLASAYVSGTAALIYSINPYLNGEQVCDILLETAAETPAGAEAPLLDAAAAVEKAADGRSSQEPATVWSSQWVEE